jgi:putative glycosyltransferase (TIGR04372 family)
MNSVGHVLSSAAYLNQADIQLTCCSHLVHDLTLLGSITVTDITLRPLNAFLDDSVYHSFVSRVLEAFIKGTTLDDLQAHLDHLYSDGYINTYSYLLNLTSSPEQAICLLTQDQATKSPFLAWVFSKYQKSSSFSFLNQPVICNHHQYLSPFSFDVFCELSTEFQYISTRIFTPQSTVSNGHIDLLVPSIYEYIILSETSPLAPPLLYTSVQHAANKSIVTLLSDAKAISLHSFNKLYTTQELINLSKSSDFISMAQSLITLNDLGISTIYSRKTVIKHPNILNRVPSWIRTNAREAGYPISSKYIAIHNRDSSYKQQSALAGRDADINTVTEALLLLGTLDSPLTRLGVAGVKSENEKIFSYDKTQDTYKIGDDTLLLNCSSLIGTSSGPGHYAASLFGVDTLFLNSTTLLPCHLILSNMVISLKHILYIPGMSVDEKLSMLLRVWFDRSTVQFTDLTTDEIASDIADFNAFLHHGKQLMSLSKLIPSSSFCHPSVLSAVFLTDRTYANLLSLLVGSDK